MLVAPLRIDDQSATVVYPRLAIRQSFEEILRDSGYLGAPFDIPICLAGDLQLLRQAQTDPFEVRWDAAARLASDSLALVRCGACRAFLQGHAPIPGEPLDAPSYVHGDLHLSNIVQDVAGMRIIDLDNLHSAPPYTDLVTFLLALGQTLPVGRHPRLLEDFIDAATFLARRFGTPLGPADLAYGAGTYLARTWLSAIWTSKAQRLLCSAVGWFTGFGTAHDPVG